MQSRRLLIVGGSVIAVILVLFGLTALFNKSGGGKKAQSTCDTFMKGMIARDYTGTYTMLTANAKKADSAESWKYKVYALANVYQDGKLTAKGNKSTTSRIANSAVASSADSTTSNPDKTSTRQEFDYTVKNAAATSDASCYAIGSQVDGFVSTLRQG